MSGPAVRAFHLAPEVFRALGLELDRLAFLSLIDQLDIIEHAINKAQIDSQPSGK